MGNEERLVGMLGSDLGSIEPISLQMLLDIAFYEQT